ncbi:peptide deformylase [Candidatus Parcubacteria bacterium]|nr:MAG: peptide deformylase [Candidatus Parcubacteria bacterium]
MELMSDIVQTGNNVLREIAKEIPVKDIKSAKTKELIGKMLESLAQTKDGVALAAPQIGVPLSVFIVLKEYIDYKPGKETPDESDSRSGQINAKKGEKPAKGKPEIAVFINPKILKISKKKQRVKEGCLSVSGIFGLTERADKVTLEAYDENGEKFTRGASGLLAQIFQHEMDHLNGILFTDSATNLEKIK